MVKNKVVDKNKDTIIAAEGSVLPSEAIGVLINHIVYVYKCDSLDCGHIEKVYKKCEEDMPLYLSQCSRKIKHLDINRRVVSRSCCDGKLTRQSYYFTFKKEIWSNIIKCVLRAHDSSYKKFIHKYYNKLSHRNDFSIDMIMKELSLVHEMDMLMRENHNQQLRCN